MPNAREVLDRGIADFDDVVRTLGFEARKCRAVCILCGTTNKTSFSFKPDAGLWHCFCCHRAGGVLDLVQAATGCDRRAALHWLADHLCLSLDDKKATAAERRAWAERRRRAEEQARELADWREEYLDGLRERRTSLWNSGRRACALGLRLMREGVDGSPQWEQVWAHCLDDLEADAVDAELERVRALAPLDLIAFRSSLAERKKAAA